MQPHERVRVEPVPARAVPPVDQRDPDVGMVDQRVGERHPGRARPDHHVVGLDHARHRLTVAATGWTGQRSFAPTAKTQVTRARVCLRSLHARDLHEGGHQALRGRHRARARTGLGAALRTRLRRPDAPRRRALPVEEQFRIVLGVCGSWPRAEAASSRLLRRTTPLLPASCTADRGDRHAPTWRAPSGSSGSPSTAWERTVGRATHNFTPQPGEVDPDELAGAVRRMGEVASRWHALPAAAR